MNTIVPVKVEFLYCILGWDYMYEISGNESSQATNYFTLTIDAITMYSFIEMRLCIVTKYLLHASVVSDNVIFCA